MPSVGHDVADAEEAQFTHIDAQFFPGLAAGAVFQRLAELQVSPGGTPGAAAQRAAPPRQEHPPFPQEHHANAHPGL